MSLFWNIKVNGVAISGDCFVDLEVRQHEAQHELAVVGMQLIKSTDLAYHNGASVRIQWGSSATETNEFFGYIDHVVPNHMTNARPGMIDVQLICVGSTLSMQNASHRSWKNRRSDSIVQEVVAGHRLSPVVDAHSYVWPSTVQAGESDWQFLIKQARRIGYSLIPLGTTVRFQDPAKAIAKATPVALYSTSDFKGAQPTINTFNPRLGNPVDYDYAERSALGVDPRSGVTSYASTYSPNTKPATGLDRLNKPRSLLVASPEASTFAGAQVIIDGMAKANWPVTADLVGSGNPSVVPGALVTVQGVGAEYAGNWYVLGARHIMDHSFMYRVQLELVRDAVRSDKSSSSYRLPEFVRIGDASKAPNTVQLPNGNWAAAWRE